MRTRALAWMTAVLVAVPVSACGDDDDGDDGAPAVEASACPAPDDLLPGTRTGPAPWPPELEHLGERLDALGLPRLTQEGRALDLHIRLSVEIDGDEVTVPSSIGLNGEEVAGGRMVSGFVSAIHTHDDSGLVHVHSPDERRYTLGQLFDVWGVSLTAERIGGHCASGDRRLVVESDGDVVDGDPRELELEDGQEITVAFGGDDA